MADYIYDDNTGVISPDTGTILTTVQNEYKVVFGSDLIVTANTPQGILINVETIARAATLANNAQIANQINPNIAGGVFLDAIGALTGSARTSAQYTLVTADLTGIPGTIIPINSIAKNNSNGEEFQTTFQVTLDGSGMASVDFQAINPGPISCQPNTLTVIVSGIYGWETVDNPLAATFIGQTTQSDVQFRNLRKVTLAGQSSSLSEAIVTALYNTPGVSSVSFRQNKDSSPQVIDGIPMVANSIYACVDGGTDNDVATALDNKKSGGCNYNGSVVVNVTDPFSGQIVPVQFDRPTEIPIAVQATIYADDEIQDPTTAVKKAIVDYANGNLSSEAGLIVGQNVSPWELSGAVNREYPSIFINDMKISPVVPLSFTRDNIVIGLDEIATISDGDIAVVIL